MIGQSFDTAERDWLKVACMHGCMASEWASYPCGDSIRRNTISRQGPVPMRQLVGE